MLTSSLAVGAYTGTERSFVIEPRTSNGRTVLWFHGAGGDTLYLEPRLAQVGKLRLVRAMVNRGYTVVSTDWGPSQGLHLWGNDSFLTSANAVYTWLGSPAKVLLWGESMGHFNACNWASRNIANVAGIIGTIPGCDAAALYARNGNGSTGESVNMDDAYGGTLGAFIDSATLAARDPITGLLASLAAVPWLGYYTTDDTVVADEAVDMAAALVGAGGTATATSLGTGGHTDVVQLGIDLGDWMAFVDGAEW